MSKDADDTKTWRVRPKFHLLHYVFDKAREGCHPKDVWNYRDLCIRLATVMVQERWLAIRPRN